MIKDGFEQILSLYLCDKNAVITGSEIVTEPLGTFSYIYYQVSKEYQLEHALTYRDRILKILLQRDPKNKGLTVSSHADSTLRNPAIKVIRQVLSERLSVQEVEQVLYDTSFWKAYNSSNDETLSSRIWASFSTLTK